MLGAGRGRRAARPGPGRPASRSSCSPRRRRRGRTTPPGRGRRGSPPRARGRTTRAPATGRRSRPATGAARRRAWTAGARARRRPRGCPRLRETPALVAITTSERDTVPSEKVAEQLLGGPVAVAGGGVDEGSRRRRGSEAPGPWPRTRRFPVPRSACRARAAKPSVRCRRRSADAWGHVTHRGSRIGTFARVSRLGPPAPIEERCDRVLPGRGPGDHPGPDRVPADLQQCPPADLPRALRMGRSGRGLLRGDPDRDRGWPFSGTSARTSSASCGPGSGRCWTPALRSDPEARKGWFVIVGSIPIVVLGVLLKHTIETSVPQPLGHRHDTGRAGRHPRHRRPDRAGETRRSRRSPGATRSSTASPSPLR